MGLFDGVKIDWEADLKTRVKVDYSRGKDENGFPYGPSVQPASLMRDEGLVIVDYDHNKRLRYWGSDRKTWVSSVSDAYRWFPKQGEPPYAENNAYSRWMHYGIGPYQVALTHGITLSPCGISCEVGKTSLFLKDIRSPEPSFLKYHDTRRIKEWTTSMDEALRIFGPDDLRAIFFEIVGDAE